MKDNTKIKLINSLIDTVGHFYDQKSTLSSSKSKHIKGFCEGVAYSLVEMDIVDGDEAKNILKGLGKKREQIEMITDELDVPTVFRKEKEGNILELDKDIDTATF